MILLLVACAAAAFGCSAKPPKKYSKTWLDLFDTVITLTGYEGNEKDFEKRAQAAYDELSLCHRLFDVYNDYEGIANIKTINDSAGGDPVKVEPAVIDLLLLGQKMYEETDGRVNILMGSVLRLWHDARTESLENPDTAHVPDPESLKRAAAHTDFGLLQIDTEKSTVRITDPEARIDVGAVAKGYAVQRVREMLPSGYLISAGGNVCITGPKPDKTAWSVGVQDPDRADQCLHVLQADRGSVVTSGDYQRYYVVDGTVYHHIIDPDTLYPADFWRAVTVLCDDSGIADGLSTALFLADQQDGQVLLDRFDAEAVWVSGDGTCLYSPGYREHIKTSE